MPQPAGDPDDHRRNSHSPFGVEVEAFESRLTTHSGRPILNGKRNSVAPPSAQPALSCSEDCYSPPYNGKRNNNAGRG
jgi:hypothetical protein